MDFMTWSEGLPEAVQPAAPVPVGPALNVTVADSFWSASGYREMGVYYSCVPDPAYPWDPSIMKRIWEFAPDAVPLWVHWVFMDSSNNVVVFGRHALGRAIRGIHSPPHEFQCAMPSMPCQGVKFERPNLIWFIHEGPSTHDENSSIPGAYLPFDESILLKARRSSVGFTMTDKEYKEHLRKELLENPREMEMARRKAHNDDLEARRLDIAPYVKRQLWKEEQMSERDIEEVFFNNVGPTPK